ncbi:MAG: hypothetical protein U9R38_01560 [Candidatus Margulisiibacteriota bacterium]|nr:hypothetical protein [Candidatus Margulisiibacteriota bacterium]
MKVLKGILKESREYYKQTEAEIVRRLSHLPKGSIKRRKINQRVYYYLQYRKGPKVVHKYLGKNKPLDLARRLKERSSLEKELKKVRSSLELLKRTKRRKRQ